MTNPQGACGLVIKVIIEVIIVMCNVVMCNVEH